MRNWAKIILLATCLSGSLAWADSFTVQAIRIVGLDGISRDTVLAYLPIKTGQRFNSENSTNIIHTLYKTGFFSDIQLLQEGNTLVVKVIERPVITSIKITGNKDIDKDQFNTVLKNLGLVEGQVFNQAVLDKVVVGLQSEYYNRGRYNAQIKTTVTPEARNRVAINIDISEGLIVKIMGINLIGNQAFATKKLLAELPIASSNLFSFFTRDDQYSREKLAQAMQVLSDYYMDRGYLKFKINASQAALTPDRKDIYITFKVTEGDIYHVNGIKLVGDLILPEAKLRSLITIKPGDKFSKQTVTDSTRAIARALGELGYTFADINPVPDINEVTHQVFLTFHIEPNKRVYVHRIKFTGNAQTEDAVLRREMRQDEGALANVVKIDESTRRLRLLPFIQDAQVNTTPVPSSVDQIDLDYSVTEAAPATAMAAVSYGTNGLGFSGSLTNNNLLGTGKTLGLSLNTDLLVRTYSINYNNPYYTESGVQRGFNIYSQRYTPGNVNITNYTYNTYGGSVNYSVPVSAKDDMLQYGLAYQNTSLNIGSSPSYEIYDFTNRYGNNFNQFLVNLGWARNGFDRAIFPTNGLNQSTGLQISLPSGGKGGKALDYYKLNYSVHWLRPLTDQFIFSAMGNVGYGGAYGATRNLPFFQNYFAGGIGYIGAVRGYATNSLGPKDSLGNPLGGNLQTTASLSLIFPTGISPDKVRTSVFIDGGNVYNTRLQEASPQQQFDGRAGPIRYASGVAVEWRIPILGVINLSIAKPLNLQKNDQSEIFQFTFGTSF